MSRARREKKRRTQNAKPMKHIGGGIFKWGSRRFRYVQVKARPVLPA